MRRDLGLIVSGQAVSTFGTCLSQLVLLLHFKDVSPVAMSGLLVASILPTSLGAPLAGLLVDRLPNRRLMQAGQLLQAAMMFTVSLVLNHTVAVLLCVFVIGCANAVAEPAAAALIPRLDGDIARGYSWMTTARSTAALIGTGLGGVLVAAIGTHAAIVVDAGTYLAQASLLLFLAVERDPRLEPVEHQRRQAMAGIRHLWSDRVLAVNIGGFAVIALAVVVINVADVFFITDVLHGGVALVGWIYAAWMIGSVAGGRFGRRLRDRRALTLALGASGVVTGSMILLPAVFPVVAVTVVAFVFGGMANALMGVARLALVRLRTPDHLRGRAFAAADSAARTASALGTLMGGLLITGLGPRSAMIIAGSAGMVAGVGMLAATRERETARVS